MTWSSKSIGARSIDSSRSSSVPGIVSARGSDAASGRYWATPWAATQPVIPTPTPIRSCSGVSSTYSPTWPRKATGTRSSPTIR